MAAYPPVTLSDDLQAQMVRAACRIARALEVKGLMNIQFVVTEGNAYVLEVNPRASRTVPYLSKITGIPMVQLGTRCMMGEKLSDLGYGSGLWAGGALGKTRDVFEEALFEPTDTPYRLPKPNFYAIKAPVFSFQKLTRVEPSLGPEMKSTGEILGIDFTYETALYKALIASGISFKPNGFVVLTVTDADKPAAVGIARELVAKGYLIASTKGTHEALVAAHIRSTEVKKIEEGSPNLLELIQSGEVALMINTPGVEKRQEHEAARIRRACIETGVACVTSIDTAVALSRALHIFENPGLASCLPYSEYLR
jgi:carbamoyl-phosphate synthase large subunit